MLNSDRSAQHHIYIQQQDGGKMPFNQDGGGPSGGEFSAAQLNFFNNFVIESVDHKGRTSMRQIVTQDNNGRASVI